MVSAADRAAQARVVTTHNGWHLDGEVLPWTELRLDAAVVAVAYSHRVLQRKDVPEGHIRRGGGAHKVGIRRSCER